MEPPGGRPCPALSGILRCARLLIKQVDLMNQLPGQRCCRQPLPPQGRGAGWGHCPREGTCAEGKSPRGSCPQEPDVTSTVPEVPRQVSAASGTPVSLTPGAHLSPSVPCVLRTVPSVASGDTHTPPRQPENRPGRETPERRGWAEPRRQDHGRAVVPACCPRRRGPGGGGCGRRLFACSVSVLCRFSLAPERRPVCPGGRLRAGLACQRRDRRRGDLCRAPVRAPSARPCAPVRAGH